MLMAGGIHKMGLLLFLIIIIGSYAVTKVFIKNMRENQRELHSLRGEQDNQKDLGDLVSEHAASKMLK